MKMRDIINTVLRLDESSEEQWVYHVTQMDSIPSIREAGLEPRPPGSEGWPEYDNDGWDDEEESDEKPPEAFEPRVFAWDDFRVAKTYIYGISGEPVILRIRKDSADWEVGETDFRYLYTTEPIPPSAIEVLTGQGAWEPLV